MIVGSPTPARCLPCSNARIELRSRNRSAPATSGLARVDRVLVRDTLRLAIPPLQIVGARIGITIIGGRRLVQADRGRCFCGTSACCTAKTTCAATFKNETASQTERDTGACTAFDFG